MKRGIFWAISGDTKSVPDWPRVKFGKIRVLDQIKDDPKYDSCFESISRCGPWAELEYLKNLLINPQIPTKSLTASNQGQVHLKENFVSFPMAYSIFGLAQYFLSNSRFSEASRVYKCIFTKYFFTSLTHCVDGMPCLASSLTVFSCLFEEKQSRR